VDGETSGLGELKKAVSKAATRKILGSIGSSARSTCLGVAIGHFLVLPLSAQTSAQTVPTIPPQDLIPLPVPTPLPTPQIPPALPPIDLQPTPVLPGAIPGAIPGTIVVERFEVLGSTIFTAAELAKITAPFTQRPISFPELLQAAAAVTKRYTDQGYLTSGAIVPPQTLEQGVVTLQVVEGELEAINITGTRRLNPNYVRSRLQLATQKPLNTRRLLEALQLLQLNPVIQTLSTELSTGTRPGQNLLEVRVEEAPAFQFQVGLDNGRSPAVGSFRRRAQLSHANLLGQSDDFRVAYENTDGSNSVDGSYTLPINSRNGALSFNFSAADSRIIESPFDAIDIESQSRSVNLTFRQPLVQTPNREIALGFTLSHQQNDTSLLGVPFQLSPGANDRGETRISALRFSQEWLNRGARSVVAVRSQFSLGVGTFATVNNDAPDSRFLAWQGQAQWARLLAPDTLLLVRSSVQLADQSLVPLEQFSVGGAVTVRGYRQDRLLTDNGAVVSAELRLPILRGANDGVLQLTPFVDFGTAWNSSGRANPDPKTLVSVGLGLQWQQSDRLSARLDWGIPLVPVASGDRTWQENGIHFTITYNLF
jgi:hemolysin activation/secretion protein